MTSLHPVTHCNVAMWQCSNVVYLSNNPDCQIARLQHCKARAGRNVVKLPDDGTPGSAAAGPSCGFARLASVTPRDSVWRAPETRLPTTPQRVRK